MTRPTAGTRFSQGPRGPDAAAQVTLQGESALWTVLLPSLGF